MTRVIWKYQLPLESQPFGIWMPINSKILHLEMQNKIPCVWAQVDKEQTKSESRVFVFVATGQHMDFGLFEIKDYVGTIMIQEYVFHLFELN